jgi:hypothetical protein
MSFDSSDSAVGRVEAHSFAGASLGDLADLAAAIERVAALLTGDADRGAGDSDTLKRIADIAFVLHERDVEPSLCDSLDAAVRNLSKAAAFKQESTRQAAEWLRELARCVNGMIAQAQLGDACVVAKSIKQTESPLGSADAGGEVAEDLIPRAGRLAADVQEGDALAQAIAQLVGVAPPTTASVPAREPQTLPDPDEDPGDLFELTADEVLAHRDAVRAPAVAASRSDVAARPEPAGLGRGSSAMQPAQPVPATMNDFRPKISADLAASAAAAPAFSQPAGKSEARPIGVPPVPPTPHVTSRVPSQSGPVPQPSDPLAAVRALSEEELIALFS